MYIKTLEENSQSLLKKKVGVNPCGFFSRDSKFGGLLFCGPGLLKTSLVLPSLKLTVKAPESGWLEDDFAILLAWPLFRGKLLVLGSVLFLWASAYISGKREVDVVLDPKFMVTDDITLKVR